MMKLSEELKKRGLLHNHTPNIEKALDEEKPTFYIGADPTADSLHLGNLLGYITARRLVDAGLKAILIVGGGTARIGDPKPDAERTLLEEEVLEKNTKAITKQVKKLLDSPDVSVVNNYEWLASFKLIEFLRDIGKNFTVNNLIKKDAIAERLKSDIGLSYTEFAYPLLQATDFLELYKRYNCKMQIGGSDQWGNIVAGIDLIRKKEGAEAHAFTFPLLVDKASNKKFGKSEGNAIWLDENKTSVYSFYQFLLNSSDEMVEELLFKLTLLPIEQIKEVIAKWQKEPHKRLAQKTLAFEVTKYVHGESKAQAAQTVSEILFGSTDTLNDLDKQSKQMLLQEAPSFSVVELPDEFTDALVYIKLASSKREAKEFIQNGAIKVWGQKVDFDFDLKNAEFKNGLLLVKRGKKNLVVLYK